MSTACYKIMGGDLERGGSASSSLKELLKRVGAAPEEVRRAVIAAYEAEMNVVIHAHRAEMLVRFHDHQVDVEVNDQGPGIEDIEAAMREGFSTAPPAMRELGFGAGMGLPNIRRNVDEFNIQSAVGQGTRLRFSVAMHQREPMQWERNSIRLLSESCTACLRCLHTCPTRAIRVHHGGPQVLGHLCIDCTSCIEVCPSGAIGMEEPEGLPEPLTGTVVVPAAFMVQFGGPATVDVVRDALLELGFERVLVSAGTDLALRQATIRWAQTEAPPGPVISPVCPAVVNLVQVRFPSLIPHVAPFLSPVEAAVRTVDGEGVFVSACPAQRTCVADGSAPTSLTMTSPRAMRRLLAPLVANAPPVPPPAVPPERVATEPADVLQTPGIQHVMRLLDGIENGLYSDLSVVEPYACPLGCFGSPLLWEEPFVARYRWRQVAADFAEDVPAVRRETPLRAREGVRLDADMDRAIAKLAKIEKLARALPGRNCGMCGAPNCSTFAEDVVLGRARVTGCPGYVNARKDRQ